MIKIWILTMIISSSDGVSTPQYKYQTKAECLDNGSKISDLVINKKDMSYNNAFSRDAVQASRFICTESYN